MARFKVSGMLLAMSVVMGVAGAEVKDEAAVRAPASQATKPATPPRKETQKATQSTARIKKIRPKERIEVDTEIAFPADI